MSGILILLFVVVSVVLSPFAYYQIITKAGFSGWWTFVPYSPVLIGFFGQIVYRTVDTDRSIGSVFDQLTLWSVLTILSAFFVDIMFFVFAFSSWPALEQARYRRPAQPSYLPAVAMHQPYVPAVANHGFAVSETPAPAPGAEPSGAQGSAAPAPGAQPSGWHRSGAVGAGEQSYWDGTAWTARRKWANGQWVELPGHTVTLDESGTTPPAP
jgi:hypothetical protein